MFWFGFYISILMIYWFIQMWAIRKVYYRSAISLDLWSLVVAVFWPVTLPFFAISTLFDKLTGVK